ncbi:MAG: class I SAM-dependent methyltransferase [Bacteroidetes bacterium]|nr:class I SAM-dependent methyltransferase [Bacteroidota bacterium]
MKKVLCGNEMDRMPDWAFRMMAFIFNIADTFKPPDRRLDGFNIQKGQTVVDWGCGTGRYLKQASGLVGDKGTVYAVDIHQFAVEAAANVAKKHNLKNIHPVRTDGTTVDIPSDVADVVYALDMFHMVTDTDSFLKELCRITKPGGTLLLEDGHQSRIMTKEKVNKSGCWDIAAETKGNIKCTPKKQPL